MLSIAIPIHNEEPAILPLWMTKRIGLIGEVLKRTYFESQGRRIYPIREVRCRREQVADGAR